MMKINIPNGVSDILNKLNDAGEKAYIVGGCVRDSLMGREPHDWDICTSAAPDKVKEIFSGHRTIDTGIKHGTVSVIGEDGGTYEVTTFRTETGYSDGRHPDRVEFANDVLKDLARRDFAINAMAYNDEEGLVDLYGGAADIESMTIRCVGNPDERFTEDGLRILRAIRFAARFGFLIEKETSESMRKTVHMLNLISTERIGSEIRQIICAPYATLAICQQLPVMGQVICALPHLMACEQNNKYHTTDVFGHTMQALHNAETCHVFPDEWADDYVRLALFFHDFGKPLAKTTDDEGHDHFYGHAKISATLTENILRQLRFSNKDIDIITELVKYHDIEFAPSKRSARRLLNKFSVEQIQRLLKIRECDNRAHSELAWPLLDRSVGFWNCLQEVLAEGTAFSFKNLAINGADVLALGVPEGPQVGTLLRYALGEVIDERLPNTREALLDFVDKWNRATPRDEEESKS